MTFPARGYPLGALFVLVTVCAVLLAGVSPLINMFQKDRIPPETFAAVMGGSLLGGMILGMILGLFQFNVGQGVAMGMGAGLVVGMTAGALSLLGSQHIWAAAIAMTAGSGFIVAIAVLMRRST